MRNSKRIGSRLAAVGLVILGLISTTLASGANAGVESDETVDSFASVLEAWGAAPAMELDAEGAPVIAYADPAADMLVIVNCEDSACEMRSEMQLDVADIGAGLALQLDSLGNPVVAFRSPGGTGLLRCIDRACVDGGRTVGVIPDTSDDAYLHRMVLTSADEPVITYTNSDSRIVVLRCLDSTCSIFLTPHPLTPPSFDGAVPTSDLTLGTNGNPIVSYVSPGRDLVVVTCGSINCSAVPAHTVQINGGFTDPQSDRTIGGFEEVRLLVVDGVLHVSATEQTDLDAYWYRTFECPLEECSIAEFQQAGAVESPGDRAIFYFDVAVNAAGEEVFVHHDVDGTGRLIVTSETDPLQRPKLMAPIPQAGVSLAADIEIHSDDTATIAHIAGADLRVLKCDDYGCVPTCNGQPVTIDVGVVHDPDGESTVLAGFDDVVRGTRFDDSISGGRTVCGLGGDDRIEVVGDASVFGGAGDDVVVAEVGRNFISGGPGNDVLTGGFRRDRIFGGPGDDVISAGRGGADWLSGGPGNDTITGGFGSDTIFGNLGRDTIRGLSGNDIIKGGGWIDNVDGGEGTDRCGIVEGEVRINCERGVFGI